MLLFTRVVAFSPFHARKRDTGRRSVVLTSGTILRITHPLYLHTHTTAPKARGPQIERGQKRGGEGEGKGAKGELLDNTRLVRTSLCTWILIGLRDY